MKAERLRIALIFIVTMAVVVGGAVYFFAIYRPKQVKKDAQAEIQTWEKRWAAARECMLGSAKPQGKTSEALAIHEMSPDAWDEHACATLVGNINRGAAPDTGLEDVERAWQELDHDAAKAANAFAMHAPDEGKPDGLPAALDALDDARAALRLAAGLPDDRATATALPAASVTPVVLGTVGVDLSDTRRELTPSVHGMIANGHANAAVVRIQLAAGGSAQVGAVPHDVPGERSLTDPSWGAVAVGDGLAIGSFGDTGEIAGGADQAMKAQPKLLGALGGAAKGTLVLSPNGKDELAIARWADGKLTIGPVTKIGDVRVGRDPGTGARLALVWSDPQGGVQGQIVTNDDASKVAELRHGTGKPITLSDDGDDDANPAERTSGPICFTADRAWTTVAHRLVSIAADGSVASPCPAGGYCPAELGAEATIAACTTDSVIVADNTRSSAFAVCTATGCRAANLPPHPWFQAITVADGKLVSVFGHAGVVAVQREGGTMTYYSVAGSPHMQTAVTDGKTVSVLASKTGGDVVIHIPLK